MVTAAALTVLLSQCRMVTDQIAPGGSASVSAADNRRPKDCFRDCQDAFAAAIDAENALHKRNELACNGDPTCLATEEARHEAAMEQIATNRNTCINSCHHQG